MAEMSAPGLLRALIEAGALPEGAEVVPRQQGYIGTANDAVIGTLNDGQQMVIVGRHLGCDPP